MKLHFIMAFCLSLFLISCDANKKTVKTSAAMENVPTKETPGVISFEAANDRYSANGKFNKWKFTKANLAKKDKIETLTAEIEIDLTSIWEKSEKLTEHLKAYDYFDVAKYTTATLTVKDVMKMKKNGEYVANMVLNMRGATQELESVFTLINGNPIQIKGTAMVDRSIFTIGVENTSVPDLIKVSYETTVPTN